MKNFLKNVLLVVCVLAISVGFWPSLTAEARMYSRDVKDNTKKDIEVYDSIEEIPTIVTDAWQIRFKPNHPAYELEGRNMLLKQILGEELKCLITFSIPEISNLDSLDIENYSYMAPTPQKKRLLLVTAEYYTAKEKSVHATSTLFVFNPEDDPIVTINLLSGGVSVEMDKIAAVVSMYSMKGVSSEIWVDDYTKKPTKTATYQSKGASMRNYEIDGWSSDKVDDATFSYNYLELPIDMQKYLKIFMYDYNESLNSTNKTAH